MKLTTKVCICANIHYSLLENNFVQLLLNETIMEKRDIFRVAAITEVEG